MHVLIVNSTAISSILLYAKNGSFQFSKRCCGDLLDMLYKNKGKIPTGKCDIEINFSDDTVVFDNNSFVECIDCVMNKPVFAKGHSFPCLNLGATEYKYKKLDEELHVKSPIMLTMDSLNQYMTNSGTIPVFYIDSRITSKLTISWKIFEPAHPKPITGELTLNINRN